MTNKLSLRPICLTLAAAVGFAASTASSQASVSASATISDVAFGGGYNYTITLDNTGTSSLKSFWYGWTITGNNLPSNPSSAGNSLGWVNTLDGNSIMWGDGTGTALTPGNTATFTFFSISTPTAITTSPSGESVAYVGAIDFSQASSTATAVFSPVLVSSPEPSTLAFMGLGALGLLAGGWRKLRAQH